MADAISNRNYWVSWYSTAEMGEWELHSPWWKSGVRGSDHAATICAAIRAISPEEVRRKVAAAYDVRIENPLTDIEWRFINQRADDWEPFTDRFPRADWMKWP